NDTLSGPIIIGVAAWLTYLVAFAGCRSAAWRKILPDHPNHRSSHIRATSKAGGVAIIVAWAIGMIVVGVFLDPPEYLRSASGLAVLTMIALVLGLADDARQFSPAVKFAGQIAIAALFIWFFAPLQAIPAPFADPILLWPVAGAALSIIWIVGFMNTYNFMDGVNGIAAGCTGVGMTIFAILCALSGALLPAAAAMLLTVACYGFLPMNFKRGRLFMGDNGSQAISFMIAALAVYTANTTANNVNILVIPIIFMPFLLDVTWTLAHRLLRGQNILAAHREHNYQLLLRLGRSHERVATYYMVGTFFCACAAGVMLATPPEYQWIFPAAISAIFMVMATQIYRKANVADLLARVELKGDRPDSDMQPAE
ncbi:MAG: glycosyltransferase family 4 protein, partial [Marinicaulis sp.]|nr:glycosyltransferase family 4 protein [Marinicaulis sp.]